VAGANQRGLFHLEAAAPVRDRTLLLVDGHALAFRSYHAIRDLTTSSGRPVGAVFGFIRAILKLLEDRPHGVVVVFDPPTPTFRHEAYAGYKATRAETPEDLPAQIEVIKRLPAMLGLRSAEVNGIEADDVVATLADRAAREGWKVEIFTTDRDAYQLLSDRVSVKTGGRGVDEIKTMDPAALRDKYGVTVDQWVDFRALVGDPSDNLPGARGIGEKKAAKLLQEWGNLDNLYANLDQVTPVSVRKALEESREDVWLSRRISAALRDAEVGVTPEEALRGKPDLAALRELFSEFEFTSLSRSLGLLEATGFKSGEWPPDDLNECVLGFTLEGPSPARGRLTGLAAASRGSVAVCPDPGPHALGGIRTVRAADAKALAVWGRSAGLDLSPGDDPLLIAYLLDPNQVDPAKLAQRYGAGDWGNTAEARAVVAARLLEALAPRLEGKLTSLYRDLELPLAAVLADLEIVGVRIDTAVLAEQSARLGERLGALEREIHELAGKPFNLNSRDQLETILYDDLGLASQRKTSKTRKRSTAASSLEALKEAHPIVEKVLEWRELSKLKSTYLDALPPLVDENGRIHTTFAQTVAATGRLSSVNPNLQNIPVRTEIGRQIRRAFVAEPGWRLLVADYSQIELRVLAHMSGEEALVEAFREGLDIHRKTAAEVFGVAYDKVTQEQRGAAKTTNFAIIYGAGAHRLSTELGLPFAEAQAFIERYFKNYPKIRAYIESTIERARQEGYVETLLGRRRPTPEITSPVRPVREYAERAAYNTPIQGTAADIIKLAMVRLPARLAQFGARMVLQVHDELIVEVPEEHARPCGQAVQEEMQGAMDLSVPLVVEVASGRNWLEAKV
jgi:DNA polymerase-1